MKKPIKEKLSLLEWLNGLQRDLESLLKQQPFRQSAEPPIFADGYFQNAVTHYLQIIQEVRPYITNPRQIISQIDELRKPDNPQIAQLLQICLEIGTFGLPHLFHPVFNQDGSCEFRGDDRCFRLAHLLRGYFEKVLKADFGILVETAKKYFPEFKNNVEILLLRLNARIANFQFNQQYRTMLRNYFEDTMPLFCKTIADLQQERFSTEALPQLLEQLIDIAEDALRRPAIIPQYIRDNPRHYFNLEKFNSSDSYSHSLRNQTARFQYHNNDSVITIEMGESIQNHLQEIMVLLRDEHGEILKLPDNQRLLMTLEQRVVSLSCRHEELNQSRGLLDDAALWSADIARNLNLLVTTLELHKSFDPEAISFQVTSNQKQTHKMQKFCNHLFRSLELYATTAGIHEEMNAHARLYVFNDLLNQTVECVLKAKRVFETNGLQHVAEYTALTDYLTAVDFYIGLFNDCVNAWQTSRSSI